MSIIGSWPRTTREPAAQECECGVLTPHYLFFASVAIAVLLFIIRTAWTWPEAVRHPRAGSSGYVG